jgi:hypothetical protein
MHEGQRKGKKLNTLRKKDRKGTEFVKGRRQERNRQPEW